MLLKFIEQVWKMLFSSLLKFFVIKLLVFKTLRNPLVQRTPDNIITITNLAKLVGEIYIVGVFIGNNLDKLLEQVTTIVTTQVNTNRQLSKWKAKVVEMDQTVQNLVNKVMPKQLPTN